VLRRGGAKANRLIILSIVTMNKALFVLGILLALTGGVLMWDGHILGERTTGVAAIIGVLGIGLIATSSGRKVRFLTLKQ